MQGLVWIAAVFAIVLVIYAGPFQPAVRLAAFWLLGLSPLIAWGASKAWTYSRYGAASVRDAYFDLAVVMVAVLTAFTLFAAWFGRRCGGGGSA